MLQRERIATLGLRLVIVFLAIFALGVLPFALKTIAGARLILPLIPSGIAVAATYRWGRKVWPAIFAGGLGIELWIHQAVVASIGVAIGLASAAWLSAWLMERGGFDSSFARAKDVPLFIVAAAAGMTLAPTFALLGYFFAGSKAFALDPVHWIRWWSNVISGVLLVSPILLNIGWRVCYGSSVL
jgi:integral membrane sensor domain MASE1